MLRQSFTACCAIACVTLTHAGGVISVDVLSPGEPGFEGIPDNFRCVDVFVDLALNEHDAWTVGAIRAVTVDLGPAGSAGDARFGYFDADANAPGIQPGLVNPGFDRRFLTSLSEPYARNSVGRFENSVAHLFGAYYPSGPEPRTEQNELNVAYGQATRPPGPDGYVARIAVDISGIDAAGIELSDYNNWGATEIGDVPAGATAILRSEGPNALQPGTGFVSFEHWQWPVGIDWALWYVPEPSSLVSLGSIAALLAYRRRASRQ